jgi:photosystem II stability/assembly factor-like uncharacterized protein
MNKFGKILIGMSILIPLLLIIFITLNDKDRKQNSRAETEKEEKGPDQYPSDWDWLRRTFPYWKADAQYFRDQVEVAQLMRSKAPYNKLLQVQVQFAGPTNIGGRISDIEFNPKDPNIVYAGAATGGVFKSTDMGLTWFPVFDDQANLNVGDIGIDPVHPDTLYVGTGEANGGHNNFPGGGVYKSTNGGVSWQFMGLENIASVGRIVVDPSNTQRVFVAAVGSYFYPNPERGLYRSEDGGQTWSLSHFISDSTGAIDVIMDPVNPSRLMVAMWERVRRPNSSHLFGPTSGIYRSLDSGDTWAYLGPANGLPDPAVEDIGRIGLAISQSNPDLVYVLYSDGLYYRGLFKSTDFGSTWTDADPNLGISNGAGGFSWYFGQVRIHPTNPDMIYTLDVSFMRSENGGANWPIIYGYGGSPADFHVDHHALAFNPANPDYLIEGNDGGINISTDAGVSWTKVANLPVSQFYEIGLDRNNPLRLYGGTQDNGTLRTMTGALNDWDHIYGGDGFYVIVDHSDPHIIYAESQFGNLGKSTNGGASWSGATNGISGATNWSTPVIMDPNNNQVLYYGAERVFRSTNGTSSWTYISPDLTPISYPRLGTITTIAVAPTNSNVIWAGTDAGNVWVSTDYGANWNEVTGNLPERWVTRVVPDPTDETIAYVTFSGLKWKDPQPHVFHTTDQGQTWTDISSNLPDAPINAFAVDPLHPNYLFVGTDLGAYYSANTGQSWQYLSSDLPMVSVYDMKIHQTANYLAIGTHARSMYKLDLSLLTGTGETPAQPVAQTFQLKQNYPNPFNPSTTIPYTLKKSSLTKLTIYNTLGQEVKTVVNENQGPGDYSVVWDGRDNTNRLVGSGTYIYRLQTGDLTRTRRMTFLK